jgi:hypothetical protein
MAHLRHTARKSVIPFLPSRLAERPLRRPVAGQSSHLERLHHRLHEEQERRRQEQQGSSFSLQQEIESVRSTIPSLSGTQLRRPCKMLHGVRFRTTPQFSAG